MLDIINNLWETWFKVFVIPTDKTQDCCIGCCKHLYSWPYFLVIKPHMYTIIFSYVHYHLALWMCNCLLLLDVFELLFAEFVWFRLSMFTIFDLLVYLHSFRFTYCKMWFICFSFHFMFMFGQCSDALFSEVFFVSFINISYEYFSPRCFNNPKIVRWRAYIGQREYIM